MSAGLSWVLDGAETPTAGCAEAELSRFAVVEILRVQDGRLAEHWDVIQQVPAAPSRQTPRSNKSGSKP